MACRGPARLVAPSASVTLSVTVPLRTVSQPHGREHHYARARRVAAERAAVLAALLDEFGLSGRAFVRSLGGPLHVTLTRIGGRGLDRTVNLPASLKAVEDQVAEWCGLDDRDDRWRCSCAQEPGPLWGVRVEIHAGRAG